MIVITIGFIITIFSIWLAWYLSKDKPDYVFSFEDTMGIHKVPVISFEHKGKIVNFIIDSGASHSVINKSSLNEFDFRLIENVEGKVYGVEGNAIETNLAYITLEKNGHKFQDIFQVMEVPGLSKIKKDHNVEIHGFLGSQFLKKYQFLINYRHLNAYTNG